PPPDRSSRSPSPEGRRRGHTCGWHRRHSVRSTPPGPRRCLWTWTFWRLGGIKGAGGVVGADVAIEVPGRIHEGVHGVGFALSGTRALGAGGVAESGIGG